MDPRPSPPARANASRRAAAACRGAVREGAAAFLGALLLAGAAAAAPAEPPTVAPAGPPAPRILDVGPAPAMQPAVLAASARLFGARLAALRERGALGCARHCAPIADTFARLVHAARSQTDDPRPLALHVTTDPQVGAMADAAGNVLVSEAFLEEASLEPEELAFVLAHEIAHVLLWHEAWGMSAASRLVRVPRASLDDLYHDLDSSLRLALRVGPVFHDLEFEADAAGMMLAALAGYDPARQLRWLERQAARDGGIELGHPRAARRLARLAGLAPIAGRLWEQHGRGGPAAVAGR